LLSAFFVRPFQAKVFIKNPVFLGLAAATYARIGQDLEKNTWLNGGKTSKNSGNTNVNSSDSQESK
jgi:hypothetical protein